MMFAWFSCVINPISCVLSLVDLCSEMDSRRNMRHSEETYSRAYQSSDMETVPLLSAA